MIYLSRYKKIKVNESQFFDFFRGASAFVVVFAHAYQVLIQPSFNEELVNKVVYFSSGFAVMVFFSLSGYMITSSICRNINNSSYNEFDIRSFFLDRILRLYPPLLLSIFIVIIVYIMAVILKLNLTEGDALYLARTKYVIDDGVIASLFFMQNIFKDFWSTPDLNAPLWSLSHEMMFYVVASLFVCLLKNRQIKTRMLCLTLLVFIFSVLFIFGKWAVLLLGFSVWLSGSILAVFHQNDFFKINKINYIALFVVSISAIISLLMLFSSDSNISYISKYAFGVTFSLFLLVMLTSDAINLTSFIENGVSQFLIRSTKYSYTLYVIHWPILLLSYGLLVPYSLFNFPVIAFQYVVTIALIVGMAKFCSKVVEDKNKIRWILDYSRGVFVKE